MLNKALNFHTLTADQSMQALETNENGLTQAQAEIRLKAFGENALTQQKRRTKIEMFLEQFKNFLVLLLAIASVISFALGETIDGTFILAIVVLNAAFGFVQEYKAEEALQALKKLTAPQATVLREGKGQKIEAKLLVPGDFVLLEAGNRIPADCRLIESTSLEVNESALTGESQPIAKDAYAVYGEKQALAERKNSIYLGTAITKGRGKAVVIATGMATEFGKIAKMVQEVENEATPLEEKLEVLGKQLGYAAIAICIAIFIIGIATGLPLAFMFFTSVSLLVAAVPEGLPAVVTITLALGVRKMVKKNSLVRKLPAVETLGSTTIICSDKTGTLTKNEMTARVLYAGGEEVKIEDGFAPPANNPAIHRALEICTLCNNATLNSGEPTEVALMQLASKGGVDKHELETQYEFAAELSFDTNRKMMSSIYKEKSGTMVAFVKGAPEVILAKSTRVLKNGREEPMDEFERKKISAKNEEMASKAMRVLALGYRELQIGTQFTEHDVERSFTFVGLVGIIDPPRPEAREAVEKCKAAGIKIVMITGDNDRTAAAIAQELGIIDHGAVVRGGEIDATNDENMLELVKETFVYARATPAHKLRIVNALQRNGEIVAMTGDGVNDAPALKKADIGIAMGRGGTEVAREASSMVLLDDNFATIVSAVEEGRKIYDNIAKSVRYLIACNIGEILVVLAATVMHWTILVPAQILWMNLVTDGAPALALGVDPGDPAAMTQAPRKPNDEVLGKRHAPRILGVALLMALATVGVYIYALQWGGAVAISMAFSTIVIQQLLYSISVRSQSIPVHRAGLFDNHLLIAVILASVALQVILTQTPLLNSIFDTVPLSLNQWLVVIAAAAVPAIAVEGYKIAVHSIHTEKTVNAV